MTDFPIAERLRYLSYLGFFFCSAQKDLASWLMMQYEMGCCLVGIKILFLIKNILYACGTENGTKLVLSLINSVYRFWLLKMW